MRSWRRLKRIDLFYDRPGYVSRFLVEEIDKIMEERTMKNILDKGRSYVPESTAILDSENISRDDLISQLPDDILYNIISRLSIREATTTSILSRRWIYLWRQLPVLDFDVINMIGKVYSMREVERQDHNEKVKFVEWVSQILRLHQGTKIESFRIKYFLGKKYYDFIDRWVGFAISKKVQNLVIDLCGPNYAPSLLLHELYDFPTDAFLERGKVSPFLKHFTLKCCTLFHPDFSVFRNLTSLTLEEIFLCRQYIDSILDHCLSLQWLSLTKCQGLDVLALPAHCVQLKHLNVCCSLSEKIEVHGAINLVSLECKTTELTDSTIRKISGLRRLCLVDLECPLTPYARVKDSFAGVSYAIGKLASDFPLLETLFLSLPTIEENMIPKQLCTYTRLKHLVLLDYGTSAESLLYLTTFLLKATPFLHGLELHFPHSSKRYAPTKRKRYALKASVKESKDCFHHEHLKKVEIYSFKGFQPEVDLVVILLKSAISLETMKIDRRERIYNGNGEWFIKSVCKVVKRRQIRRLLRKEASPTTKLIVL